MGTSLDIAVVGTWGGFALACISLISAIYSRFTSGARKNSQAINALIEKHSQLDGRVQTIEIKIEYLPSKDEINELNISITAVRGEVSSLTKTSLATEQGVRRLENLLLKKKHDSI